MKKLHYFMLSTLLLSHSAFSSENDMPLLKDLGDSIEFNHRSLFVTNSTPKNPMQGFTVDYTTYLYPMWDPMVGCTYFPKQVRKDPQARREAERDSVNELIHNPLFEIDMKSLVETQGQQNVRIYTVGHVNIFFDTLTQHTEIHTMHAAPQLVESYAAFYEKLTHTALDHIKTFKTYCCEDKLPLFVQCLPTLQITELDLSLVIHHEKELHLEGTETAIKNLWTVIQNHPTLTTLHLKGIFTPEQQTDLCKAIESNSTLTSFHAEGQTLSTETQEMIESFMVRNRNASK